MEFTLENLNDLVKVAIEHNASDIHIRTDEPPYLRIRGELITIKTQIFTKNTVKDICKIIFNNDEKIAHLDKINELDGGFEFHNLCRLRYNFFRYSGKIGIICRVITYKIPTLDELKLTSVIKTIANQRRGLILVTGATGAGKSTTLASIIDYINKNRSTHIITIEDPIEYVHSTQKSKITQRELHIDTVDYPTALKSALRQDPNIILIGEMRDPETISTALKAAETGHTVFSTMHTTNSLSTIGRIVSMFPSQEQDEVKKRLSENLFATIGQRLIRAKTESGLIAAQEIMLNNHNIKECILGEQAFSNINTIIQNGYEKSGNGSQSFDQHLLALYKKHLITEEVALNAATSKSDFMQKLIVS